MVFALLFQGPAPVPALSLGPTSPSSKAAILSFHPGESDGDLRHGVAWRIVGLSRRSTACRGRRKLRLAGKRCLSEAETQPALIRLAELLAIAVAGRDSSTTFIRIRALVLDGPPRDTTR